MTGLETCFLVAHLLQNIQRSGTIVQATFKVRRFFLEGIEIYIVLETYQYPDLLCSKGPLAVDDGTKASVLFEPSSPREKVILESINNRITKVVKTLIRNLYLDAYGYGESVA